MLYLISELREKERDNNNNNMTTRKTHNISVITSVGTKNIILPSYRYIHYLSASNMPISRIVNNTFNKGGFVVKKPHMKVWDFVRPVLIGLIILFTMILLGANFDLKTL